ncbi:aldehyde ferredoxin oxidoreductase C-terminal domain-containing protein, partial [Chloroflexota bacterium]
WGKGVLETDHLVKEELGDPNIRVGAIGLAGENQVSMANIVFETNRAGASRMGGQIMASKNLKAIAMRGSGAIDLADKTLVRELSRDLIKRINENQMCISRATGGGSHTQGLTCQIGSAPIKNLTTSVFDDIAGVAPEMIMGHYTKANAGCPGCPIHHHFSWEIKDGPYAGEKGVGLEGGVIMLWAGLVGNSYAPAVFAANKLCNDYGIDELETAMAISAAMEWLEKGIISKKDLDGLDLKFGDHAAMMEMIHRIARRQGFGDLLAEGPVAAAEKLGKSAQECINYGKGRISAWLDWRVLKGGYLSEVTSSPACEMMDGWPGGWEILKTMGKVTPELSALGTARFGSPEAFDQLSYNKARAVAYCQDFAIVIDSLDLCKFITDWMFACCTMKDAADLFQAVTGIDMGEEGFIKAAGRIRDLERAYWVREGYTRKDDRLEGKIMNEPVPDGPFKGASLDKAEIEKMLDEFYQLRGWDVKTGIPTREKLLEDGLEDIVADLEKRGKL